MEMRAYAIAAVVAGMGAFSAPARSQERENTADVMVYVTGTGLLSGFKDGLIRSAVDEMFARAGVSITWVNGKPKGGSAAGAAVVVHVQVVRQWTNAYRAETLAYAAPFAQGLKTITVHYDRIRMIAGTRGREPHVLAHVLAHELGHVLQGSNWHAANGVMKARWSCEDFLAMQKRPLEFTLTDLDLIRGGLNRLKAEAGYMPSGAHEW
jgi:hypothetical protein